MSLLAGSKFFCKRGYSTLSILGRKGSMGLHTGLSFCSEEPREYAKGFRVGFAMMRGFSSTTMPPSFTSSMGRVSARCMVVTTGLDFAWFARRRGIIHDHWFVTGRRRVG